MRRAVLERFLAGPSEIEQMQTDIEIIRAGRASITAAYGQSGGRGAGISDPTGQVAIKLDGRLTALDKRRKQYDEDMQAVMDWIAGLRDPKLKKVALGYYIRGWGTSRIARMLRRSRTQVYRDIERIEGVLEDGEGEILPDMDAGRAYSAAGNADTGADIDRDGAAIGQDGERDCIAPGDAAAGGDRTGTDAEMDAGEDHAAGGNGRAGHDGEGKGGGARRKRSGDSGGGSAIRHRKGVKN